MDVISKFLKTNKEQLITYKPGDKYWSQYRFAKNLRERVKKCEEMCQMYEKFVHEVIAPYILSYFENEDTLLYQYPPTLRIYPSEDPPLLLGRMHRDSEFNHQAGEINFWLPIINAQGTATLWAESQSNLGDFHPFILSYGQIQQFYGTKCRHFGLRNDTGKTRISLDFRVAADSCFDKNWVLPQSFNIHQRRVFKLKKKNKQSKEEINIQIKDKNDESISLKEEIQKKQQDK